MRTTLLWGLPEDGPTAWVRAELERRGTPYRLLNQRDVLRTRVAVRCHAGELRGSVQRDGPARIEGDGDDLDLAQVGAVYARPHESARLPGLAGLDPQSPQLRHAAAVDQALYSWLEVTRAFVVNPPSACATNASKPLQARLIRRCGFRIPETVVTSDPARAREFAREHKDIVFKSVSAVRSRVRRAGPEELERLGDVRSGPVQFQEWVPGTDVRVHVVGVQVFATQLSCTADDYRYAAQLGHAPAELAPTVLPPAVALACLRLSAALRLPVTGIDLRVTPEGEWYCFEANPSPAFPYYEGSTGQPIGASIAALLTAAAVAS
jgi:glutathione synthase/RimK-type ligase-like ATP-grasp enzyme